jgi:hypothetical protein
MSLQQMSALGGGRGFKRNYVEEINARKRYLPQLYGMKEAERSRKQNLGLQQRGFAQDQEVLAQNRERLGIEKDRYAQEQDRLGLERDRFAQERAFGLSQQSLAEDAAHEARKRNKQAQNLGLANIGLGAGLGLYDAFGQPSFSDIGGWIGDLFSPAEALSDADLFDFDVLDF